MALNNSLTRDLTRGLTRSLTRSGEAGAGVDDLLIDDEGDHYIIEDETTDVRIIED